MLWFLGFYCCFNMQTLVDLKCSPLFICIHVVANPLALHKPLSVTLVAVEVQ